MVLPNNIKINVLKECLLGLKREQIAQNNGISTGSVSMIIDEFRKDIADIDILREMSLHINASGNGINDYFGAIRHNNHLKKLGLTEEKAECIIETMHEYSFKNGMTIQEFFERIVYLLIAEVEMGIPISKMPRWLTINRMEYDTLQAKIIQEDKRFKDLFRFHKIKEEELEDFIKLKPIHENLKKTRDQLHLETQRNHELSKDNNHLRMELEEKDRIIKALKKKINNNSRKDDIKDDDEDVNDEEEYENSDEVSDNKDEDN